MISYWAIIHGSSEINLVAMLSFGPQTLVFCLKVLVVIKLSLKMMNQKRAFCNGWVQRLKIPPKARSKPQEFWRFDVVASILLWSLQLPIWMTCWQRLSGRDHAMRKRVGIQIEIPNDFLFGANAWVRSGVAVAHGCMRYCPWYWPFVFQVAAIVVEDRREMCADSPADHRWTNLYGGRELGRVSQHTWSYHCPKLQRHSAAQPGS